MTDDNPPAGPPADEGHRTRRRSRSRSNGADRGTSAPPEPVRRPLALWIFAAIVLAISSWLIPQAWTTLRADLIASPARRYIDQQARSNLPLTTVAEWREGLDRLQRAVDLQPDNATTHSELGLMYQAGLGLSELTEQEHEQAGQHAVEHLRQATRLRPADPRLWANLARGLLLSAQLGPEFYEAWERAAVLGPYEAVIRTGLMQLALVTAPDATSPPMADWVKQRWAEADEKQRTALRKQAAVFDVLIDDDGSLAAAPASIAASAPASATSR